MNPSSLVETLSPAQNHNLQLVKAMHRNAKILIMDEPTASLGESESQALMKMVKQMAEHGLGIIYISHYLEEVFAIADRITVLKDGHITGVYEAASLSHEEVINAMVGRETSLFYKRERTPLGETVLDARNFTRMPAVNDVSFNLRKGEILGFGGLVGSGRSELMNLIFGVDKKQNGTLKLNNKEISIHSPKDAIKKGFCMLGENRKEDGLFIDRPVLENVCVVRNEEKVTISMSKDRKSMDEMVKKLNIKTAGYDQDVGYLSGGNQQKSIIARWLLAKSQIIIFDEPTKGVDVGAREEIYKLMVDLVKQGKSIIMVSSDMVEILSMSDRICIMREGVLEDIVEAKDMDEESLLRMYIGAA
jgi:ribose transport system ATP-binding protein